MTTYQTIGRLSYKQYVEMPDSLKKMLKEFFPVSEYYKLPEVKYCRKCVISTQRPRIHFDEDGVCSACRFAEKKQNANWEEREEQLRGLLEKHRSNDGSWDVVVPSSGGKDSAFVAHKLKYEYNMHPLTVTWAPHIYTGVGWYNFQALVHSGLDNVLGTPDGLLHRILTRASLIKMGDIFQPFIYGQKAFPISTAVRYGIPLIMYGENGEVEYGGDSKNEELPTHNITSDIEKHYISGFKLTDWADCGISAKDLSCYQMPKIEDAERVGIECHFLSFYKKWVPQQNYYYTVENTGFKPEPDGRSEGTYSKYASLDDKLAGYHNYFAYLKFGHGRATSDAAHEIRDGHITREEGVALVHKFDGEFPTKHFKEVLEYLMMTEDEFIQCCERFRNQDIWKKDEATGDWRLKRQVS
jgi:N-acetyl sugar amidotransferase|tara:strand:+ start:3944 stop:5179 length:1236 start_codon:yes stop_codon:yes gene_type:complete